MADTSQQPDGGGGEALAVAEKVQQEARLAEDQHEGKETQKEEKENPAAQQMVEVSLAEEGGEKGAGAAGEEAKAVDEGGEGVEKEKWTNIIVFFNSKSGGQVGPIVEKAMKAHLPADRIFDLAKSRKEGWRPQDKLRLFRDVPNLRVLACGGDGTMGWIFSCIDGVQHELKMNRSPDAPAANDMCEFPLAMMPLGTGNDLSRSFRWGTRFRTKMLKPRFLDKVESATTHTLDRWLICVMPYDPVGDKKKIEENLPPTFTVHSYTEGKAGSAMIQGTTYSEAAASEARRLAQQDHKQRKERQQTEGEDALNDSDSDSDQDDKGEEKKKEEAETGQTVEEGGQVKEEEAVGMVAEIGGKKVRMVEVTENPPKPDEVLDVRPELHPMPSETVLTTHNTWESYDGVFCNYFSLGVDAVAAGAFHEYREEHPEKFTSPTKNKLWYVLKGFPAAGGMPCCVPPPAPIKRYLTMQIKPVGGGEWEDVKLSSGLRGLIVLNLQSYAGGKNLWGDDKGRFKTALPNDGCLEVVGVGNIYGLGITLGMNKMGKHAARICQASEIKIRMRDSVYMQCDGEPWKQNKATIHIKHYGRSSCLVQKKKTVNF